MPCTTARMVSAATSTVATVATETMPVARTHQKVSPLKWANETAAVAAVERGNTDAHL